MKKHPFGRRAAALALAFALLAGQASAVYADDKKDDLQQSVDQAQDEYDQAREDLENQQQNVDQAQGQVDAISGQLGSVQAQLDKVYASLQETATQLAAAQQRQAMAEAALAEKQAQYDETWADTKQMMNAMQKMHDGGSIQLLSQAADLYELLTFSSVLDEMNGSYQNTLDKLETEAAALDAQRREAEAAAAELDAAQTALEQQQAELDAMQGQLSQALQEADATLSRQEADLQAQQQLSDEALRRLKEAEAELDRYVASQNNQYTTIHCSLDFRCPLDSYGSITTRYGEPDPWGRGHNGTDFAAGGGTPIYAAADGVVSVAASHYSYGNYVQISHGTADDGNNYSTLYAHMRNYVVSVGQTVAKGDLIGYVGNTGQVSGKYGGYHLHLELRVNGSRTNPLTYIPC